MKKVCCIVGARPQFIKHAPLSQEMTGQFRECLVHTGQHYDKNMSQVFFDNLNMKKPDYNLGIGSTTHGAQTGGMLIKIEEVLLSERPDIVIIYGDTNSTIAGALAAKKLHIPVAHIEAGLRSYNMKMPEEINRVATDHISDLLLCPSDTAVRNLQAEGIHQNVFLTGDIMYDAVAHYSMKIEQNQTLFDRLSIEPHTYFLATVHRAENTDNLERLKEIICAFNDADQNIIFCVHPRTKKIITSNGIKLNRKVIIAEPVGYFDMLLLQKKALKVLTDSGGIQKEAYFLNIPCITLRDETEWIETVEIGANILVGAEKIKILDAILNFNPTPSTRPKCYGDGNARKRITEAISNLLQ